MQVRKQASLFTDNGVAPPVTTLAPTTTQAPTTTLDTTIAPDDEFENLFNLLQDELNLNQIQELFPNGLDQIREDPVAGLTQLQAALDQIRTEDYPISGFETLGPQTFLVFIVLIFMHFFK